MSRGSHWYCARLIQNYQSRHAALVELEGGYVAAEAGYENALWLLQVLLDDHFYEEGKIKDEDKAGVEKCKLPSSSAYP